MLDVGSVIEFIDEDTSDFNLISWSCSINKIVKNEDFLLSWHSTWWYGSWGFLNGPFLIISVNRFVLLMNIWTFALANNTFSEELLLIVVVIVHNWAFKIITL